MRIRSTARLTSRTARIVVVVLTAILVALSGCAAKTPRAAPGTDEYDRDFLNDAVGHLDGDLRIARTCEGKQIRSELANFCTQLYDDQLWEYARLADMLDQWYQEDPPVDPFPLWLGSQDGETFERYFLKGVLDGHRKLARNAAKCQRQAKHGELATLCEEVSLHRTQEAAKLERWNCEWFKQCD